MNCNYRNLSYSYIKLLGYVFHRKREMIKYKAKKCVFDSNLLSLFSFMIACFDQIDTFNQILKELQNPILWLPKIYIQKISQN